MKKIMILALLVGAQMPLAFADTVEIAGTINSADCSQVVVKPAQKQDAGKCVVVFSGVSQSTKMEDGTIASSSYEGAIAVMGQEMKPLELVGKKLFLEVDFQKSEIVSWGQRN